MYGAPSIRLALVSSDRAPSIRRGSPYSGFIPDRLARPGRSLHGPEIAGNQPISSVKDRNAFELGLRELELSGRKILCEPSWSYRLRNGRNPGADLPGDQDLS